MMESRTHLRQLSIPFLLALLIGLPALLLAQTKPSLPVHVIEQFGEAPKVLDGPLSPAYQFAARVAFVDSTTRGCLLYTSPSPRDKRQSRMPSSA